MENNPNTPQNTETPTPPAKEATGELEPSGVTHQDQPPEITLHETSRVIHREKQTRSASSNLRTLAVDLGGSGIKVEILDGKGKPLTGRARVPTPRPATPQAIIGQIQKLAKAQGTFDRVSVGFPGVVRNGVIHTAPNLGPQWKNCNLEKRLRQKLRRPVRVANDADVQGFGVIRGRGVEMVLTLGTGVGSALFVNGILVPNLELGHHPFLKGKTYEERLGRAALEKAGKKKWNNRLLKAINQLQLIFNYDMLYLGGGNAKHITAKLPPHTKVVSNQAGLWGGLALWREKR